MARTLIFLVLYLTILMPITPARLAAEPDLEYQNRGARYEGCKPKPVSAFDIKLILVFAVTRIRPNQLPHQLRVKSYLKSRPQ